MTGKEQRRLTLRLYPGETLGDQVALDFIDGQRATERGPAMRELLLAGAALSLIDPRLPRLVASTFDENMNLERLKNLINSVVPGAFNSTELNAAVMAALSANHSATVTDEGQGKPLGSQPVGEPKAAKSKEEILKEETLRNGMNMLGGNDDD